MSAARLGALGLLALAWAAIFLVEPWSAEGVSDLYVYRTTAGLFLDGFLPYRDVAFEYPPLAAPVLTLPGLVGTGEEPYRLAFGLLMVVFAALATLLTGRLAAQTGGDPWRGLLALALAPLATGALIRTHYDLLPVVLTLIALSALVAQRTRLGFAVLGLAVMAKGFPLVVAPVALAWLLSRGERRAAIRGVAALAVTVGALSAAALALSPEGAVDAVRYQLERPAQVESSPASILIVLDSLGAGEADGVESHRSDGLVHPAADAVSAIFAALLVGAVAALAMLATRPPAGPRPAGLEHAHTAWQKPAAAGDDNRAGPRELVLASLAAVAAFAAFGQVLSPQFVVWILPLAGLAFAWRLHGLAVTAAAATVLTFVEFPSRYFDLVAREPFPVAVIAARNLALMAVVLLSMQALRDSERAGAAGALRAPAAAAARSIVPARPRRTRSTRRSTTDPRPRSRT